MPADYQTALGSMTEDQISDAANSGPLGDCERCGAAGETIDIDRQRDEIISVCWACCSRRYRPGDNHA